MVIRHTGIGGTEMQFGLLGMAALYVRPNPVADHALISYDIAARCSRRIFIYDIHGRAVAAIVSGMVAPGRYQVLWNCRDDRGRLLPGGVYFCRLQAGDFQATQKLLLLR
jgi:hypothetical protein